MGQSIENMLTVEYLGVLGRISKRSDKCYVNSCDGITKETLNDAVMHLKIVLKERYNLIEKHV